MNTFYKFFGLFSSLLVVGTLVLFAFGETTSAKRPLIKKQFERKHVELHVHVFKTTDALHKAIKKYKPEDIEWIVGFAVWSLHDRRCDIYVLEAKDEERFQDWGHELAHCIYGSWHEE